LIEPKGFEGASKDELWIKIMDEELHQMEKNHTWELVPGPMYNKVINTKLVFRNKLNEDEQVTRNKARFVSKGYTRVDSIKFEETCYPLVRMEEIRLILVYACSNNIKVYQMDVKSSFLNVEIEE
jgi:hypothetical protein